MGELNMLNFDVGAFKKALPEEIAKAVEACGQHAARESKRNAPRSPTKKQGSATLKRKRRSKQRRAPGGLERSIEYEVTPDSATIFVAQNAACRTAKGFNYAKRIHDEKGVTWFKRGAGTVAKGARADEKFIERAIKENAGRYEQRIQQAVSAALGKI